MDVRLSSFLAAGQVLVDSRVADKWTAIDSLLTTVGTGEGVHIEKARSAVLDRERQISTGLEQGIALPHGMLPGDFRTIGALGIIPDGVDFDALDGSPVHFVVLMLFPDTAAGRSLHVSLLAQTLRVFTDHGLRRELMSTTEASDALSIVADHERTRGV